MKLHYLNSEILREPTELVQAEELDYVKSLVPEMTKIMTDEGGVGLAANQVGISKRFFIMRLNDEVKLIINPIITSLEKFDLFEEGCLSIPGTSAPVNRAHEITMSYYDDQFVLVSVTLKDLEAIAAQHEVDHLNGKLYIDQLGDLKRMLVLNKHKKFMKR